MDINKIKDQIVQIKKDKNALILAHNYQLPEIQDCADFVTDSLGLAQKAVGVKNNLIVLCGVYFMAETVSLLNPGKTVLIPDKNAGCPLANFADAEMVRNWKKQYPDYAFVAYVNSSAEVKAEVDICCTSSNAVKVVNSLDNDNIVFLPDKNLGAYVQKQVKSKNILLWPGYCIVHENADMESVIETKEKYPDALLIAHPECREELLELADGICSTGQMFTYVEKHPEVKYFIVITEWGINYALKKRFPDREFIEPRKRMECANMKKITPEKLLLSLEKEEDKVMVEENIAVKARLAIERMLRVGS